MTEQSTTNSYWKTKNILLNFRVKVQHPSIHHRGCVSARTEPLRSCRPKNVWVCMCVCAKCVANVNMWHSGRTDGNIFEVLQRRAALMWLQAFCTGGLTVQHGGPAEFNTAASACDCTQICCSDTPQLLSKKRGLLQMWRKIIVIINERGQLVLPFEMMSCIQPSSD